MNKEKATKAICKRLEDINIGKGMKDNVEVEKLILFILDKVKSGTFRGVIKIKINDNRIYDPRIDEQVIALEREYSYLDL